MRSSLRRALACASALLALAATTSATVAPATSATVPGRASEPTVGTCYAMTYHEGVLPTNTAPVVDCAQRHTARVILVFQAPAGVDMNDAHAVGQVLSQRCSGAAVKAIGGTPSERYLAVFYWLWFQPTQTEIDAGDRTLECDLALYGGKRRMAPLTSDAEPALTGKPPYDDSVRKCITRANRYAPCTLPHRFRSTTDFRVRGKQYPSKQVLQRLDRQHCGGRVRDYTLNPSAEEWKAGFRLALCLVQTQA